MYKPIDNFIKRYRAPNVHDNIFEKIQLRACLFLSSGKVKDVYSNKTNSIKKGLIGIDGEKEKRKRVLKEEKFIQNQGPIWHETQYMYMYV